jgi:hypothetical protein
MRAFFVGLTGSLVALAGFAGSASASATIDLIWAGSGTATTSGVVSSSSITLNVVLTAGAKGVLAIGMSIDYTALAGDFTVGGNFQSFQGGPLPGGLGSTTDSGTQINNFNAAAFAGGLAPFASYLLGTVTFHATTGTPGSFQIDSGKFVLTDDVIAASDFSVITGTTTFNSGFAVVPEPGTLFLLSMGLGGLYVVGRRSNRKR